MLPTIATPSTVRLPRRRSPVLRSALAAASGVAAAAALVSSAVASTSPAPSIQSLVLSPTDVTTGGTSAGTVTIGPVWKLKTTIQLASSNPRLASVPTSVTIGPAQDRESFAVRTLSGPSGCADITATLGTTTRRTSIFVFPQPTPSGSPVRVAVPTSVVGSQTVTGRVNLVGVPAGTYTVQLGSSDPSVATVPASVTVTATLTEAGVIGSATFPIRTVIVDRMRCSVISASLSGTISRGLVKIFTISG